MATRKTFAKKTVLFDEHDQAIGVKFAFTHGATHTVLLAELPANVTGHAAAHGISQKLGDGYGSSDEVTTSEDAERVFLSHLDNLRGGDWNTRSTGGGIIIEAIARVKGISVADVVKVWESLDKAKQDEAKADPRTKAAIAEIRAERAAKRADAVEDTGKSALDVFGS